MLERVEVYIPFVQFSSKTMKYFGMHINEAYCMMFVTASHNYTSI